MFAFSALSRANTAINAMMLPAAGRPATLSTAAKGPSGGSAWEGSRIATITKTEPM